MTWPPFFCGESSFSSALPRSDALLGSRDWRSYALASFVSNYVEFGQSLLLRPMLNDGTAIETFTSLIKSIWYYVVGNGFALEYRAKVGCARALPLLTFSGV